MDAGPQSRRRRRLELDPKQGSRHRFRRAVERLTPSQGGAYVDLAELPPKGSDQVRIVDIELMRLQFAVELREISHSLFAPGVLTEPSSLHRWFTGKIVGQPRSSVSLGVRAHGDVYGTILHTDPGTRQQLIIELAPDAHGRLTARPGKMPQDARLQDAIGHHIEKLDDIERGTGSRFRRGAESEETTCEVFVDADKWFYAHHGGAGSKARRLEKSKLKMLDIMLGVMDIFYYNFQVAIKNQTEPDFRGPYLYVVGAAVHTNRVFAVEDPTMHTKAEKQLSSYQQYLKDDSWYKDRPSGKQAHDVCLNHLFTHATFDPVVGLANFGAACANNGRNSAFTSTSSGGKQMSLTATMTVTAHEIGHNFGAEHDCDDKGGSEMLCENWIKGADTPDIENMCLEGDDHYLMYPTVHSGANIHKFSPCSLHLIDQARKRHFSCFIERSANMDHVPTQPPPRTTPEPERTTTAVRYYKEYNDDPGTFVGEFDFLFDETPRVVALWPKSAPGPTLITIIGSNLNNTTLVELGGKECGELNIVNNTAIQCRSQWLSAGRYPVVVHSAAGVAAHPLDKGDVSFVSVLRFFDVSPHSGSFGGGTEVTITGNGFGTNVDGIVVKVDSLRAFVVSVNHTQIVFIAPKYFETALSKVDTSVMVSVQAESWLSKDFGQLLEIKHTVVTPQIPANTLADTMQSMKDQAVGIGLEHKSDEAQLITPTWYTVMSSSCTGAKCLYIYDRAVTPQLTLISPNFGSKDNIIQIMGVGLQPDGVEAFPYVTIGGAECTYIDFAERTDVPCPGDVTSHCNGHSFVCRVGETPMGTHAIYASVPTVGLALSLPFEARGSADTIAPVVGSVGGGDDVLISGIGFGNSTESTEVSLCGVPCNVRSSTYTAITCRTGELNLASGMEAFHHIESAAIRPDKDHTIGRIMSGAAPAFGTTASVANFAFDRQYQSEFRSVQREGCWVGLDLGANRRAVVSRVRWFPVNRIQESGKQYLTPGGEIMVGGIFEGATNQSGPWTLLGTISKPAQGWNYIDVNISIPFRYLRYNGNASRSACHLSELEFVGAVLQSSEVCHPTITTRPPKAHEAVFYQDRRKAESFAQPAIKFRFDTNITPVVDTISPLIGTSLGGTNVTILGRRLPTSLTRVEVLVNGHTCLVTAVATDGTEVNCTTTKRTKFMPSTVVVRHSVSDPSEGWTGSSVSSVAAKRRFFRYLDRWSETNTWLNDEPPGEGDSVYIPLDQTLYLDTQPPRLQVLLVHGLLVFADTVDVTLDAEYILVQGGKMEIGTKDRPHTHKVVITLHGDEKTAIGLPGIGSKV